MVGRNPTKERLAETLKMLRTLKLGTNAHFPSYLLIKEKYKFIITTIFLESNWALQMTIS